MSLKYGTNKLMRKAFTLLELLVVIGIISILVSLGTFSYSTAQKKARDTKRKGDVNAISNALEQYYSVCGFSYPTPDSGTAFTTVTCPTGPVVIMTGVPIDPKANPYACVGCNASTYQICANGMESEAPTGFCKSNQQ